MTHRSLSLISLLVLSVAPTADAQERGDSSLFRAVAGSVRAELPVGLVVLDPRVLQRGQTLKGPAAAGQNHDPATLLALQAAFGQQTARIEDIVSCPGNPSTCRLLEGVAAISVGKPEGHGDTVAVRVFAAFATPSRRQPVAMLEEVLILVRRAGQDWLVVGKRVERVS